MIFKLQYSDDAINDIRNIAHYIASDLHSPAAAMRISKGIDKRIEKILIFPRNARRLLAGKDFRFVTFESYLIIYRIVGDVVRIVRVVHSKMDYTRLF